MITTPIPKSFRDHAMLAMGILIVAFEAARHLFLRALGWGLRNRQLVWWFCSMYSRVFCLCWYIVGQLVGEFGWAFAGGVLISYIQQR